MEPDVVTSVEELKQAITDYRRRIAQTKKLYDYYQSIYYPAWPEAWESVDAALKTRAHYWRGEIIRAKHNLARYIRGEDPVLQRMYFLQNMQGSELSTQLNALQEAVELCSQRRQPKAVGSLDWDYYQLCCETMKKDSEYTERFIYAG